jgi:hypothetical protein
VPEIPFTIELFELSSDPHDQSRFERRRKLTLLSREAWLPSAEDVIVQKLRWCKRAKRGKDFDDVVSVLGVQGPDTLDWRYIENRPITQLAFYTVPSSPDPRLAHILIF